MVCVSDHIPYQFPSGHFDMKIYEKTPYDDAFDGAIPLPSFM